jgi:integrase
MRPRRRFVSWPRHPLTGKQFRVSARSERELAATMHDIDTLRIDYAHGRRTADEVDRAIRRLVHGAVTLERAAASYVAGVRPNTARRVASFLVASGAELARLDVHELDGPRLAAWIASLRSKGLEDSTIGTHWRTLRALVRHAAERGWIARVPWGSWRPSRLRSSAARVREAARDPGELAALLDAAFLVDHGQRGLEAKIACAALLGLRQGELAGLRWCDIDASTRTVTIARQYDGAPTKTGPCKALAALPQLFDLLAVHMVRLEREELYAPDGPVFPSIRYSAPGRPRPYARGECLTRGDLRSVVAKSGLPNAKNWSAHSLRDSFATLEHETHGTDLRALAERTRHASLASLVRYLRSRSRTAAPPGFALPRNPPALPQPDKK